MSLKHKNYPGCAFEMLVDNDGKHIDVLGSNDYSLVCVTKLIEISTRKVIKVCIAEVVFKDKMDKVIIENDLKMR